MPNGRSRVGRPICIGVEEDMVRGQWESRRTARLRFWLFTDAEVGGVPIREDAMNKRKEATGRIGKEDERGIGCRRGRRRRRQTSRAVVVGMARMWLVQSRRGLRYCSEITKSFHRLTRCSHESAIDRVRCLNQ